MNIMLFVVVHLYSSFPIDFQNFPRGANFCNNCRSHFSISYKSSSVSNAVTNAASLRPHF